MPHADPVGPAATLAPVEWLPALSRYLETGPCAVLIGDADGGLLHANTAACDQLGLDMARARGQRPEAVLRADAGTSSSGGEVWPDLRQRALRDGFASARALVQGAGDDAFWADLRLDVMRDAQGRPTHQLLRITDVTAERIQRELQAVVIEAMAHERPLAELMALVCTQVETLAPEVVATVLAVDRRGRLRPLAGPSFDPAVAASFDGLPIGPSVCSCGSAAWRREPVIVADVARDPRWHGRAEGVLGLGLAACWSWPILGPGREVLGTFAFYHRTPTGPKTLHRRLVETSRDLCALAFEREQTRDRLRTLAQHDALTGLPNRGLLHDQVHKLLAAARRTGQSVGVLLIDIDRFKHINDTQGHAVGDTVLRQVARRLARVVRSGDLVGRLAGDEFIVVLPRCDRADLEQTAERILRSLSRTFEIGERRLACPSSIGVAVCPGDGDDFDTLVRHADLAMVEAKGGGRARISFYSSTMTEGAQERLQIEDALRGAFVRGEMSLVFQPVVALTPGIGPTDPRAGAVGYSLHGVEALLRWQHPVLGAVAPSRFVPLAESCGLIGELSQWVIEGATAQMALWQAQGVAVPHVAINLSAHDFHDPGLLARISSALTRHGLRGDQLTLELTESALMDRRADALRTLEGLEALGVGLALDDFGTGYSSLSHVHHLPIRQVKLDQSFVRDLASDRTAQALTTAVLRIGESLNLAVVAEGVETEAQALFLQALGCVLLQGHHYAHPLRPDALARWMAERSPTGLH